MTEQFALTLAAAALGLVAAILLLIGNILQSTRQMILGTRQFWDFNPQAIRHLAAQRAYRVTGAGLLAVSFLIQIGASIASTYIPADLPMALQAWPSFLLAVMVVAGLLSAVVARFYAAAIMREILRLHREGLE